MAITDINSEDRLVQATFAEHLEKVLGWDSVYAWNQETFGLDGTLGRADTREAVLKRDLRAALVKLNPGLPAKVIGDAVSTLTRYDFSRSLIQHNQEFYRLIRDGVPVSYRDAKGDLRHAQAQVIDFRNPTNNRFLAVRELKLTGLRAPGYNRRADLVCFVNGLPLVFIELKAVYKNIRAGFEGNLKDYLDEYVIAHAFHHNAFLIVSNGHRARYGSITSAWEHFAEWKRLDERDPGRVDAEILLDGLLDKTRLLNIVENFILFDASKAGATRKIVARNHQVLGVNNAVAAVIRQEELKRQFPPERRLNYRMIELPREHSLPPCGGVLGSGISSSLPPCGGVLGSGISSSLPPCGGGLGSGISGSLPPCGGGLGWGEERCRQSNKLQIDADALPHPHLPLQGGKESSDEPRTVRLPEPAHPELGKLGVFWHTQGSGKSYSMAFFTEKVRRQIPGNFTFLLMTDRDDLDGQIYRTFVGCGVADDHTPRASSGEALKQLLQQNHRYLFSLIHKFNQDVNPDQPYSRRDDIIVISDEAHRTQAGKLARNMRLALPNAAFIGFTGTPLFQDDELTRRIFGDYVSRYDFKRSEEDGATVKLVYENRGEKLGLSRLDLNDRIADAIEKADLNPDQSPSSAPCG